MKVYLIFIISFICLRLDAQINEEYRSFGLSNQIEEIIMPSQDNARLRQAEIRSRKKGRPDCFAKSLKTQIDPKLNGTWDYTRKGNRHLATKDNL